VRYKDLNGDNIIDGKDRTFLGNPNPKFVFGFNNTFTYGKLDLAVAMNGAVGGKISNQQMEWGQILVGFFNVYDNVKDRWRSEQNPGAGQVPSTRSGTEELARMFNTRFVSDASYLKVQNITLGYAVPALSKYVRKIRVYGSIQNPVIFTKYQGANPEVSLFGLNGLQQGADVTNYPITRVMSVGLNVGF
jgi:TonB-dependent starch-binding outer membrane protein SusC